MEPKDIKTLVQAYFERLYNKRDLSVCDALLASHYVDHDAPSEISPGPEGTKQFAVELLSDYPNLKVRVVDIIAGDLKAAIQIVRTGTHHKSGFKLHQQGNIIIHLNAEGYFVESWSVYQSVNP